MIYRDFSTLLKEAKRRDERAAKEAEEQESEAKYERERGTLGEYYPAFAPGCSAKLVPSDWYDGNDNEF
tara:strand:+ start:6539 stop:6745 length:207 start_codon:yes stop_codon:yes gene_type:complete